ncbi:MAG: Peptidyl-prolyl cis-trans isomerase [Parcubacteria group bacterium GW2011_GWA1_36_12]|nr:MAG: Peptidyl-prolyl cis-trans isomerase [Parcubacteria group bacterium GW2011_GWA1_36_12]
MKNLVLTIGASIIIIAGIFLFASQNNASQNKNENDTINPTSVPVGSPQANILNNQPDSSTQKMPFPILTKEEIAGKKIKISTNKGEIVIELLADAPIASSNLLYLVNKHFYDGLTFHRVIKGFMIQGGDPTGTGNGGPGYQFQDELDAASASYQKGYVRGTLAMANAGPNTNGSQFFIMHQDYKLPHNYTIFGSLISGMETVDSIANSQVDENDKPNQPVVMNKVTIE